VRKILQVTGLDSVFRLVGEAHLTRPAVPRTYTVRRMRAGTIGRMPPDQVAVVIAVRDEADRIEATVTAALGLPKAGLMLVVDDATARPVKAGPW
jgi:hypothetical protein